MKTYKLLIPALFSVVILLTSCVKDLDTIPLNPEKLTSATAFNDTNTYAQLLAKIYGAMTLTGQRGPYGDRDIAEPANDEGYASFLRMYWNAQEITTDEAINAWGDANQIELHGHKWSDQNFLNLKLYQRLFITITLCNEYVRVVGSKVGGLSGNLKTEVSRYIYEARFLRALNYYFAIDLWGNVPFVTEADAVGAFLPPQIKRADLFNYIESELKAIAPSLLPPNQNPAHYAKANRAAAWMLLAKLYLNAEVYLGAGNSKYSECITYCDSIISAGYSLHPNYLELFLADNNLCQDEIIFPIAEDGLYTQNYGGVTYIVHASCPGGDTYADYYGIRGGASNQGWSGNRFPATFSTKFDDLTGSTDQRATFDTVGRQAEINNYNEFTQGYLSRKFRNITSTGDRGKHNDIVDTDFPLFRLGDTYLMYAEAVVRSGNTNKIGTATIYINLLRERAHGGDDYANITADELTLDFLIDERARELQWEAQRRTDLIRFGKFTGGAYIWEWKGDVKAGIPTDPHYNLFPIPSSDLGINTNLVQNPGY